MTTQANGQAPPPPSRDKLADMLAAGPMTEGYKATLPWWAYATADSGMFPQFFILREIEQMLISPTVRSALRYFKSGIYGAEFDVEADSSQVGEFALEQTQRFWDRGVPIMQEGYNYGWLGTEQLYSFDDGPLKWIGMKDFSPRDTFLLTQDHKPVGVRVKQVQDRPDVDLWLATPDVPAKALWYAHEPRYGAFYGETALLGAWKPWRRLESKDGASAIADAAVYRHGYEGPLGRYPEEDLQATTQLPATALDSAGNPRRYARDVMRQFVEWAKAGYSVGLPSTKYPPEQGGDYKWDFKWNERTINVDGLIAYIKMLKDEIMLGIGVPPELMQAAETGSGYSGRIIPLEAFLVQQQKIGDRMLALFIEHVLGPLVSWNWGSRVRFDVKLKPFLMVKRAQQGGQTAETPPEQNAMQQSGQNAGQREQGLAGPTRQQGKPSMPFSLESPLMLTDRIREIARHALAAAGRLPASGRLAA